MKIFVKKRGNSASVRIPVAVMQAAHLKLDQAVEVFEENGRIVIQPLREEPVSLDHLVAGITPEITHGSVDFGEKRGREVW